MVVIVLSCKIKVIHQSHRLLETRVEHRTLERFRTKSLNSIQQLEAGFSELADNFLDFPSVVAGFMGLAIGEVCRSQLA
jgi:predicted nucleic acid-binding protein